MSIDLGNTLLGVRKVGVSANKSEKEKHLSFGQGQLNMIATSDNHGKVDSVGNLYATIAANKDDIFSNADQKGVVNAGFHSGDWFMNPASRGYKTNPDATSGDHQLAFFNKLVDSTTKLVPGFKMYYTPGNHCLDGGDKFLFNLLKKSSLKTVITNANFQNSPTIQSMTPEDKVKFSESEVIEIPDDKDANKKHKVLALGLTQLSVDFYNNSLVTGLDVLDRSDKKDIKVEEKDLKNTYAKLNNVVGKFKKENPQGAVVIMGHLGNKITEYVTKNVSGINMVLNGHDHVDKDNTVKDKDGKDVKIVSNWENNQKVQGLSMHFNDNGDLDAIKSKPYYTLKGEQPAAKEFTELFEKLFKEDKKPLFDVVVKNEPNSPQNGKKIESKNIRFENNPVANFVGDAMLAAVKKLEPDTDAFIGYTATLRDGMTPGKPVNNLELKKILAGCTEDFAQVYTSKMNGEALLDVLIEDTKDNIENKNRNPIIFSSGVEIDKKGMAEELAKTKEKLDLPFIMLNDKKYNKFFKIKNEKGEYVPIDLNKKYKVAIPKEFFHVPNIKFFVKMKDNFKPVGKTLYELFNMYLQDNKSIAALDLKENRLKT